MKTFYEETGIKSVAGDLLLQDITTKQRAKFLTLLYHFRFELRNVKTYMSSRLIFKHFKDRLITNPDQHKMSFKLNVLKCVFEFENQHNKRVKWNNNK